jgi:hypothetical protein
MVSLQEMLATTREAQLAFLCEIGMTLLQTRQDGPVDEG